MLKSGLPIIGWIGTGVMGLSMCSHIIKAGYNVNIFNRSKEKMSQLIQMGAVFKANPGEVASNSEFIFTMVGTPRDVEDVYFGPAGIFKGVKKGSILIDMTTSEPSLAKRINHSAKVYDIDALDAPVSGGDVGAKNAALAIMVGGEQNAYERVMPLFQLMGKTIALMGPAGAGQHTKMANQITIANNMIGVVEALLYAFKAGLSLDQVVDVISKGAAESWSLVNLGRRMINGNFDPGFYIKHFVKDMGIALDEAKRMNLSLPGLSQANQFYIAAIAQGLENNGTQGLYKVLAQLNNIPIPSKKL